MRSSRRRICVLSLQRLGDVLTAARVTGALAERDDVETVELVHWDRTEQAAAMLPGVDRRHPLPHHELHRRGRCHPLAAFALLRDHVRALRDRGFDQVVSLTSSSFAALLGPALLEPGGSLLGPRIDDHGTFVPGHPAIAHLDDWGVEPDLGVFAHRDLYAVAAGVDPHAPARLPADREADAWVARRLGADEPAPIALHLHGSQPEKDWRDPFSMSGWCGLVAELRRRLERPILLLGAPAEAPELERVAAATGARVAAWSFRHTASLLARAAGLVSVDTVAIHLAALVGCPSVVLREGPARGLAFVPGPAALLVDRARADASVGDIASLCERHLCGRPLPEARATELGSRLRVRRGFVDEAGYLGAQVPAWLPAPPDALVRDGIEQAWREVWRSTWGGPAPGRPILAHLAAADPLRWARASILLDSVADDRRRVA